MSISDVSRVSKISSIDWSKECFIWSLFGERSNCLKEISKEVIQRRICFSFVSSMIYFPVSLLIWPVLSFVHINSLLIARYHRWNSVRDYLSPRQNSIKRSLYLVPSNPSWGIMLKITMIRSSNPLPNCMLVTGLTCGFGAFYDKTVVSLTR